jgi:hypothetical protein
MAKKNKRLISKKTKKKVKAAAPWALAIAATGGMLAAFADRRIRGRVSSFAADTVEKVRPARKSESNGIISHESGAV